MVRDLSTPSSEPNHQFFFHCKSVDQRRFLKVTGDGVQPVGRRCSVLIGPHRVGRGGDNEATDLKISVDDAVRVAVVDALEDLLDAVRGVGFAVELAGHDVLEEFAARDPLDETIETNSMETLERRNITMEDRRFSLQSSSFLSFSVFFLFYRRIRCSRPSPANPEERNTTTNRKQDGKVGEKREKIREERREKKRERAN